MLRLSQCGIFHILFQSFVKVQHFRLTFQLSISKSASMCLTSFFKTLLPKWNQILWVSKIWKSHTVSALFVLLCGWILAGNIFACQFTPLCQALWLSEKVDVKLLSHKSTEQRKVKRWLAACLSLSQPFYEITTPTALNQGAFFIYGMEPLQLTLCLSERIWI